MRRWALGLLVLILGACATEPAQEEETTTCPSTTISYWVSQSPTDSIPLPGVDVYIFDQLGDTLHAITGTDGGFTIIGNICTPIRARIEYNGQYQEMGTWQNKTDCSTCHYPGNNQGAPGYIYIGG